MSLSAEQQAQVAALVAANTVAYQRVEQNMLNAITAVLRQLFGFGWFNPALVRESTTQLVDIVEDAQQAIAALTESYADAVMAAMDLQVPPKLLRRPVTLPAQLRKVNPRVEWERPARDARIARLLGFDEFEANERALRRAEQQARMDASLARREAERQRWGISTEVIGTRRVLRPEKSQHGPCGLCVVASTRIYGPGELKPLHGGCVCDSLPVTATADPGNDMNAADFEVWSRRGEILEKIGLTNDDLRAYYTAAGGTSRAGLQRVRVRTINHGELGPILVDNKYKNRTAGQSRKLAEQKMDPQRIFDIQSGLVAKFEKDLADGKTVSAATLAFHRRLRDEWAKKLAA